MAIAIKNIQEILTLSHISNHMLVKQIYPYYIPTIVEKLFKENQTGIILVEFNKVILFGQITLSESENLLIGPLTTKDLFYETPLKVFAYLKSSQKYTRLKKIIDQQANFTLEDLKELLGKIAKIVLGHPLETKIFKRNDYPKNNDYFKDNISNEDMIRQFHAAINHGDKDRFVHLATYPQAYLNSFIHLNKTSPKYMRKEFYNSLITASNIAMRNGISSEVLQQIQNKYMDLWQETNLTPIKAGHIMFSSMLEIMDLIKSHRLFNTQDSLIKRVYNYIDKHEQQPINRQIIAEALKVSPTYLSTYFKEHTGQTLTHFIQKYKIDKAEMFLESENMSIIEISNYLGFRNVTYFNRIFKKVTGQTPSDYRKTH